MPPRPPHSRAFATLLVVALVSSSAVLAGSALPVGADDTIDDLRQQREAARDAAAAAIAQLDVLELEDAEVAAALEELTAGVDSQRARVDGARQALEAAEAEVSTREQRVVATSTDIAELEEEVSRRVVESYVGETDESVDWLSSDDLNRTAVRRALIEFSFGGDRDAFDVLRQKHAELEEDLLAGIRASNDARRSRARLEDELAELETRVETQQALQDEIQTRIVEWEQAVAAQEREAEEFTDLIRRTQVETLGFDLGDPGAASVQGFVVPVDGTIGSGFGERRHPIFGTIRMHNGVDLSGASGDPVWSSKEGVVIYAGWRGGYGNTVIIQHEGDIATLYGHLLEIDVEVGNWVGTAEVIARVGSTGLSTGPHLHFEVRRDGVPEDPELYLPV